MRLSGTPTAAVVSVNPSAEFEVPGAPAAVVSGAPSVEDAVVGSGMDQNEQFALSGVDEMIDGDLMGIDKGYKVVQRLCSGLISRINRATSCPRLLGTVGALPAVVPVVVLAAVWGLIRTAVVRDLRR